MSSNQSNLSSSKYGYDMVVGTTQDSINATMKSYLSKYDGEEVIMCYVYDADVPEGQSNTVATDFDAYKEKLGFDPFDVPTPGDGEELDPRVQTLEDNFFLFAFKATMGLPGPPAGTPPNDVQDYMDNLPDIVVLGTSNSSVTYNLYCKEFQILDLELGGFGDDSWSNISQPTYPDNPWVFSFSVDLDLYNNDSAFNTLNTQTQNDVKNLCPDSMFSVQQLYLDLNTADLESSPDIPNLDPNSQTAYYLTKMFFNTYLQDIQEKETSESNPDGNYMLGYTIQSSDSSSSSSVVPTDLNFMVSPFLDDQGNPSDNFNLYTLNWLIMTNTHSMPAPVPFEWNWVEEADQNNFSGSMSINKNFFVNFLNQVFSENLNTICMIPKCTVSAWTVSFDIEFNKEPNAQAYQLVNDGTSKVLTFYYHKTSSADDKAYLHTVQTSIECDYTLTSDVYFEGSTIRVVTTSDTYLYVNIDGGVTKGHVCKYVSTVNYDIAVQGDELVITGGQPTVEDKSDDIDPSTWGTIITFGQMDNIAEGLQKTIEDSVKAFASGYNSNILDMLNGSKAFVFPGGTTFSFKNASFSNGLDLTTDITYNDPT